MRRSVEHLILVALAMSMMGCQGIPLTEQAAQKLSNTPTVASPDNRIVLPTLDATSGIPESTPVIIFTPTPLAVRTEAATVAAPTPEAQIGDKNEPAEISAGLKRIAGFLKGENEFSDEQLKKNSFGPMGMDLHKANYLGILQGAQNGSDGLMQAVLLYSSSDGENRYFVFGSQMKPEMGGGRFVFKAYFPEKLARDGGGGEPVFLMSSTTFNASQSGRPDLMKSNADYQQFIQAQMDKPVVIQLVTHQDQDPLNIPQLKRYVELINNGGPAATEILNLAQRVTAGYERYSAGDGSTGDGVWGSASGVFKSDQMPDEAYLKNNKVDPLHNPIVNCYYIRR